MNSLECRQLEHTAQLFEACRFESLPKIADAGPKIAPHHVSGIFMGNGSAAQVPPQCDRKKRCISRSCWLLGFFLLLPPHVLCAKREHQRRVLLGSMFGVGSCATTLDAPHCCCHYKPEHARQSISAILMTTLGHDRANWEREQERVRQMDRDRHQQKCAHHTRQALV